MVNCGHRAVIVRVFIQILSSKSCFYGCQLPCSEDHVFLIVAGCIFRFSIKGAELSLLSTPMALMKGWWLLHAPLPSRL